jgi:hypothetical protein
MRTYAMLAPPAAHHRRTPSDRPCSYSPVASRMENTLPFVCFNARWIYRAIKVIIILRFPYNAGIREHAVFVRIALI